jgi:hypothetical protein
MPLLELRPPNSVSMECRGSARSGPGASMGTASPSRPCESMPLIFFSHKGDTMLHAPVVDVFNTVARACVGGDWTFLSLVRNPSVVVVVVEVVVCRVPTSTVTSAAAAPTAARAAVQSAGLGCGGMALAVHVVSSSASGGTFARFASGGRLPATGKLPVETNGFCQALQFWTDGGMVVLFHTGAALLLLLLLQWF